MDYLIIDIEVLKDYVNINLKDNNEVHQKYKIHAVAYANYYVRIGSIISKENLTNLLNESTYYFIKDSIIKKLKTKDYSKYEIKELAKDKLDVDSIDRLINDLERNNYINDYVYVKRIYNDAQNKLKGINYINNKLKNKEIDDNIIESFNNNYNEEYYANKLVNNELNKLMNKYPKNSLINKISYKLNYNGFSENTIRSQIDLLSNKHFKENNDLLKKDLLKSIKKYQNKYENKELERKVIESLVAKGYNYKSVKTLLEGMNEND